MSAFEAIGFGWVVLSVGLFTSAVLIAATYVAVVGVKTTRERLRLGEEYQKQYDQQVADQAWLKKQEGR